MDCSQVVTFKAIEAVQLSYPDIPWVEVLTCLAKQANQKEHGAVLLAPAPGTELGWVGCETGDWVGISNAPKEPFVVPLKALVALGVDLEPAVDDRFWNFLVDETIFPYWERWVTLHPVVHQITTISTSHYPVKIPRDRWAEGIMGIRTYSPTGRPAPVAIRLLKYGFDVHHVATSVWNNGKLLEIQSGLRLWLCESNWTIGSNLPVVETA